MDEKLKEALKVINRAKNDLEFIVNLAESEAELRKEAERVLNGLKTFLADSFRKERNDLFTDMGFSVKPISEQLEDIATGRIEVGVR